MAKFQIQTPTFFLSQKSQSESLDITSSGNGVYVVLSGNAVCSRYVNQSWNRIPLSSAKITKITRVCLSPVVPQNHERQKKCDKMTIETKIKILTKYYNYDC